jgi:hypothetical protein
MAGRTCGMTSRNLCEKRSGKGHSNYHLCMEPVIPDQTHTHRCTACGGW